MYGKEVLSRGDLRKHHAVKVGVLEQELEFRLITANATNKHNRKQTGKCFEGVKEYAKYYLVFLSEKHPANDRFSDVTAISTLAA